jgi:hypothetical protein
MHIFIHWYIEKPSQVKASWRGMLFYSWCPEDDLGRGKV